MIEHPQPIPDPALLPDPRWEAVEEARAEIILSHLKGDPAAWDECFTNFTTAFEEAIRIDERAERDQTLEWVEGALRRLLSTAVAPDIGPWRDVFVSNFNALTDYCHDREHGAPPERAMEHAKANVIRQPTTESSPPPPQTPSLNLE